MSVVHEPRNFIYDGGYPPMDDHTDPTVDADRFADPTDSIVDLGGAGSYNAPPPPFVDTDTRLDLVAAAAAVPAPPSSKEDSPTATTPQRIKAIPKPDRLVVKNVEGKFVCDWPGCKEDLREFSRKCEWNKHMDKHDRPYKCASEGCEKLPGFTYSGGLLRHEREVHGKHGGPKNSLNCPHINCKRHTGKGFSRLENLNEHLRRVHTNNGTTEGETDDGASETAVGQKRKRDTDEVDLREENKKLRSENDELRRQLEGQNRQTIAMVQRIAQLEHAQRLSQTQLETSRRMSQLDGQPQLAPDAPML